MIDQYNLNKLFQNFCKNHFDLKNLYKYLEDEDKGIFTFEFIQKIYLVSFVFKNLVLDVAKAPLISERRRYLRGNDHS